MTTSKGLRTGSRLGAYNLESFLGAGGMGEVYRAKDIRLGRWVAIKVLLPHISTDIEARRRFEQEARAIVLAPHIFGGLVRVPADGAVPKPLTSLAEGEGSHAWPQVIAERDVVIFTGGPANAPNVQVSSLSSRATKIVVAAGYCGRYVPSGHLIYVHTNTLFAVRFDIDRLESRGAPVPIVDDVADDVTDRTAHFSFANDGTLAYLSRGAVTSDRTIVWMDRSGGVEKLLATPGRYAYLFPSPDGRKLAFVSAQDIWVLDLRRGRPTRVSFNTLDNQWPVWAPDSAHLVFSAQSRSEVGRSLWWLRADGAEEPHLLLESDEELHPSSVSPDGKHVAIHRRSSCAARSPRPCPS